MRRRFALLALMLGSVAPATAAQDAAARAQEWLALLDATQYAEAWAQAAPRLREGLDTQPWSQRIRHGRRGNGAVACRKRVAVEHLMQPPRVAAVFVTQFADGNRIGERVTLSPDLTQVLDYRVGPAAIDHGAPCSATTTPEARR